MSAVKTHRLRIALIVLMAAHSLLALEWLSNDARPLFWDSGAHSRQVLKAHQALYRWAPPIRGKLLSESMREAAFESPIAARVLSGPFAGLANWTEAFYRGSAYPSLTYLIGGLGIALVGPSADGLAVVVGLVWFLVTILGTYLLTSELRDESAGLLAACLAGATPLLLGLARTPMTDGALTAMVVMAMWSLVRCRDFTDRRASLGLGLCCGLGMLAKQPFLVFLLLPVAWVALRVLRDRYANEDRAVERLRNVAGAFFVALLIAGPWYLYVPYVLSMLGDPNRLGDFGTLLVGHSSRWTLDYVFFYPRNLVSDAMGPFFATLGVVGLAAMISDRRIRDRALVPLVLLGAVVFFGYLHPIKAVRFVAPILPLLAATSAIAVFSISRPWIRRILTISIVALCALTIVGSTVADLDEEASGLSTLGMGSRLFSIHTVETHPPERQGLEHDLMLDTIRSHADPEAERLWLYIVQTGRPYHSQAVVLTTPELLMFEDGVPGQPIVIADHLEEIPEDEGFYLIIALQQGFEQRPPPSYQWLSAEDLSILQRIQNHRPIAERHGLANGMGVRLFRFASGSDGRNGGG